MKKQVGLKFEEEDLARWDVFAESLGWTRTTLFETAVERLIAAGEKQAPGKAGRSPTVVADSEPARGRGPVVEPAREARPGVRRAYVCQHKECVPPRRVFLHDEPAGFVPECPGHGRMVLQGNRPYFGQSTV